MKNHLLYAFCLFWLSLSAPLYANTLTVNDIKSSNPTFKCFGDATTLSVGDYSTYLWSTGQTTPTIRATEPGYYTVIVTDASGCSGTSNKFRLTGKGSGETMSEIEDIYGNTILCRGESVTLIGGRDPAKRYWWSTGDTTSFITLSENSSVFLIEIFPNGCELQPSSGVNINVFDAEPPTIEVTGATLFCNENDVTILTATYDTDYDFAWSNGDRSSSITLSAPGTYYAKSMNSVGCEVVSNSVTIQAVNQSIPQLSSSGGDLILCIDEQLTLSTTSPAFGYIWSTGDTGTEITVAEGGMYNLSLLDANGCKSVPASIEVQKPELMVPEILYNGSLLFCDGSSLILSANINPFYIWQWQNGSNTFDTLITQSGTFHINAVDQLSGCVLNSDTIEVKVGEIRSPTVSVVGSTVLCEGDSVILESSPAAEYYWLGPGTDVVDNISQRFVVYEGGTYKLAIVNDFGCVAAAEPIEVFLDTLANDPEILGHRNFGLNNFKTYYTKTIPETKVEWRIQGGEIDFPNKDTIAVIWTSAGDLELCVDYTSPKGCVVKTACINNKETAIEDAALAGVQLFPNPVINFLEFQIPGNQAIYNVEIYSQHGQLVKQFSLLQQPQVDVSYLATGHYFCTFNLADKRYFKKWYKQ